MTLQLEESDSCLIDGLNHNFDFVAMESGYCFWMCKFCDVTQTEYEDTQP